MKDIVILRSLTAGQKTLFQPEIQLNVAFPRKGARARIEKTKLEEALSFPGVQAMFEEGLIGIIEGATYEELMGFYVDDPTPPYELTDEEMKRLLVEAKKEELDEVLERLSEDQIFELIRYAVGQNLVYPVSAEAIRKKTGQNLYKMRDLAQDAKEESSK